MYDNFKQMITIDNNNFQLRVNFFTMNINRIKYTYLNHSMY